YQHLVCEEVARTVQPNVDAFIEYNAEINPAIVAEFAHTVYRFGHSMLTETIDRLDPNFNSSEIRLIQAFLNPLPFAASGPETIDRLDPNFNSSEIGLIQAFLTPLAFAASGPTPEQAAGAIVRGV